MCQAVVTVSKGGYGPSTGVHAVTANRGEPILLNTTSAPMKRLGLTVGMWYEIVEQSGTRRANRWRVRTSAYEYSLVDDKYQEVAAFHWHPGGRSLVGWPHLHIGSALSYSTYLTDAHLPTGRVAFEQVVRLLIEDLGVGPRRADWERTLDAAYQLFLQNRTWA